MRLLIGMVNLAEMLSGWLIGKRNGWTPDTRDYGG